MKQLFKIALTLIFIGTLMSCADSSDLDELNILDERQSIEGSSDAILDGGDGTTNNIGSVGSVGSGPPPPPNPPGGTSSPYDD